MTAAGIHIFLIHLQLYACKTHPCDKFLSVRWGLFLSFHKKLKCFAVFSENKYLLFKQSELINNQHLVVYLWSGTMQTLWSFLPLLFSVTDPWNLLKWYTKFDSLFQYFVTVISLLYGQYYYAKIIFTNVDRRYGFKFNVRKQLAFWK